METFLINVERDLYRHSPTDSFKREAHNQFEEFKGLYHSLFSTYGMDFLVQVLKK